MTRIVSLSQQHLRAAQGLSAQQGWPHGAAEWRQMLALWQGVAALHREQVVGTTLWWCHDRAATLGMVIVDSACRGQGIAAQLVQAALDRIGDLPVMLTATDMARNGYARLGFQQVGMVDTCRGPAIGEHVNDPQIVAEFNDEVLALDAAARGWGRGPILRSLMAGDATCWCVKEGRHTVAYALDRAMGPGRVIGPIVAQTPEIAEALVRHCLAVHPDVLMRVDTDLTLGLSDRLTALGLHKQGWGTVMIRGALAPSPAGTPRVFGLVSQACN